MICPICGREFFRPPAVSRRDPSVLICSCCGSREALEDASVENIEEILDKMYGDDVEGLLLELKRPNHQISPLSLALLGTTSLKTDGLW